ncbi:hypothetical protein SEA_REMUSLOOPIN_44 [Streptomyces phage RemusLoopin]|uniref:Lipoprotein n=1 Tax=Streptomyces phage RemusLoopin TaxID=2562346 RepID=A0A4D6E3X3_9CAUD|nr:hypothetical protein SEA_REMUSLOOPIN_44 [Streptomyces phage RemusLoopin]
MNPYGKDKMGLGTKVAAAASVALVGALMVAGCSADDDDTRCDTYTTVGFGVPAPRPAPAPAPRPAPAPAPKPNLTKPTTPKSPKTGGTTVVPVPVNPGPTTHTVCHDRDDD